MCVPKLTHQNFVSFSSEKVLLKQHFLLDGILLYLQDDIPFVPKPLHCSALVIGQLILWGCKINSTSKKVFWNYFGCCHSYMGYSNVTCAATLLFSKKRFMAHSHLPPFLGSGPNILGKVRQKMHAPKSRHISADWPGQQHLYPLVLC